MKKFLVSMVAVFAATSAFATENLSINLDSVQKKTVVNNSQKPFSSNSYFAQPVVGNQGQLVGLEIGLLVDKHDENVALLRPLGKYKVAGLNLQTVSAASISTNGKKVYGGLGLMADFGSVTPGLEVKFGVVAPGAEVTNGFKISNEFVPAVQAKVDVVTLSRNIVSIPSKFEKTVRSFFHTPIKKD
jgi:hypothetical protein